MNKSVAKSSIILIIAGIVCKILGALFRLPLTNILGVTGIGYFQMVMSLYAFTLVLCSGGITITLSKLVAEPCENKQKRVNSLYKISILTSLVLGAVVGAVFLLLSKNISSLQGGTFGNVYRLMIILLPLGGIIACFRGVLQGFETMYPTAVSQVIEQGIRFVFGLLFASIFIKKGVDMGVFGAFLGIVVGEALSAIYLLYEIKKRKVKFEGKEYKGFYKNLFPILLGGCILPLVNALDSLIIVNRLSIAGFTKSQAVLLYGVQTGVVGTVLNLPAIISSSLAIALLPSIAAMKENPVAQKQRICTAFKYLWFVLLPMVLGIMAIAKPLYTIIYPNIEYQILQYAVNLTLLGGISAILLAIMQFLITILQARGKLLNMMILQVAGGALKFFIVYKFCAVPEINVYGLILGNILLSSVVIIGSLVELGDLVEISFFDLFLPALGAVAMYMCVSIFVETAKLSPISLVVLSVVIGIAIYALLNLRTLYSSIKYFARKRKV